MLLGRISGTRRLQRGIVNVLSYLPTNQCQGHFCISLPQSSVSSPIRWNSGISGSKNAEGGNKSAPASKIPSPTAPSSSQGSANNGTSNNITILELARRASGDKTKTKNSSNDVSNSNNDNKGSEGSNIVHQNSTGSSIPRLKVTLRTFEQQGSRKSRKMREAGFVPGVIYGLDNSWKEMKKTIWLPRKEIEAEMRKRGRSLENTLYEIEVEGENTIYCATPRQLQVNPLTDAPLNVNFVIYHPGNRIRIPLEFANADLSDDIRRGCFIVSVNKFLECQCSGEIPQKLLVDLTGCKKNDVITLSNIILPSGVSPSTKVSMRKFVVGVVKSSRG